MPPSVCLSGGCELGQGLYTKVAQAVAYKFGIDVSLVNVVATRSSVSPTPITTGAPVRVHCTLPNAHAVSAPCTSTCSVSSLSACALSF